MFNDDSSIELNACRLCARSCAVDRNHGRKGYCGEDTQLNIARAALHFYEEPCISGCKADGTYNGSGAIFFSGCALKCVFCQNSNIALGNVGTCITVDRLVEIFFELKAQGANNINLVTPTHYIYQVREAIIKAKQQGFNLPFVYNTGSYERSETLKLLDGLIDVYLPDLKYYDAELSRRYSNAANYFEVASMAIAEMVRQTKEPEFDDNGIIRRGVIVRHLVLPGSTKDSKRVIEYLYNTYGDRIFISIMNQYTPMRNDFEGELANLNRKVTQREYNRVIDFALELGVENAFIQEGDTASESFIPDFNMEGVTSNERNGI